MAGASLTCARDGTPTQLTCTKCQTPICPDCLVRTDVGLRCPGCAGAPAARPATGRDRRPLIVGGAVVVAVLALVGLAVVRSGGSDGSGTSTAKPPQTVTRPDLGFSVQLPATWVVDVDPTPGSIFFARSTPAKSSARLFRAQTDQPLEQTMVNVVEGLRQQGAQDFSQQPVDVGGLGGIRLDYVAADGPAGARATHSSYRVKKGNAVFSLSLATTAPEADGAVLAGIAASFRLL